MRKTAAAAALSLLLALATPALADLTIVQNVEGAGIMANTAMTIKIKGDKVRVEPSPEMVSIIDSKTGDTVSLIKQQKIAMRMSGEETRKAMAGAAGMTGVTGAKPQPKSTGKKETINGHETEEFVIETPSYTAHYAVAKNYPNGAEIVKQLQSTSKAWNSSMPSLPDVGDFPGLPLRTKVKMQGMEMTSTITSVSNAAIPDSEFVVPSDYKDMKMPSMPAANAPAPAGAAASAAPSPKKP